MTSLLSRLLASPCQVLRAGDVQSWWSQWSDLARALQTPIDRAIVGGSVADRLGFAFAAGYHAALASLVPELSAEHLVAFCATEEGGAHPRAINSTLAPAPGGYELQGQKRWSTLAPEARELLVVASIGRDPAGKNRLRIARLPADAPGITIRPMPPTPFAPEIPHAEISFDSVRVAEREIFEGDAWERYVKPFRTVEDLHVHGALLGYLIGVARRHTRPQADVERLICLAVATRALALEPPGAAETHVAVAGLLAATSSAVVDTSARWADVEPDERVRWERDRGLLQVAETARSARRQRAWQRLSGVEIDPVGS